MEWLFFKKYKAGGFYSKPEPEKQREDAGKE
jgi:hypothetical protein